MRKSLLIPLSLLVSLISTSQSIMHEGERSAEVAHKFIDSTDFKYIRIVSFNCCWISYEGKELDYFRQETIEVKNNNRIHEKIKSFKYKNLHLNYVNLKEMKVIRNNSSINAVLKIINNENIVDSVKASSFLCYDPRNAILFYNDKNEIVGFYEICFTCNNYISSKRKNLNYRGLGPGNLNRLKKFFLDNGVMFVEESED